MDNLFTPAQKENLAYFWENLDEFSKNPLLNHKHVVVHSKQIVAANDTPDAALAFALKNFSRGTYVIQEVIRDDEVVNFLYSAA